MVFIDDGNFPVYKIEMIVGFAFLHFFPSSFGSFFFWIRKLAHETGISS